MGTTQPLPPTFATAILDGNGNGVAQAGPARAREHWQPSSAAVSVAPVPPAILRTNEAQCSVFLGTSINSATFLAQTQTGSTGDTCGFGGQDMQTGEQIWAQWTGGDPGAVATVVIKGTYSIGAPV